MIAKFTVVGEPKGKGRPKFAKVGNFVKTYTPDQTVIYENLVKIEFQRQCKNIKFGDYDELKMTINAYYSIPKSASKKKTNLMLEGKIRPTKKPDIDNIIKVIADSLNGIAYRDDAQIVELVATKNYSDNPKVFITIEKL